jgi:hypothetical protein
MVVTTSALCTDADASTGASPVATKSEVTVTP